MRDIKAIITLLRPQMRHHEDLMDGHRFEDIPEWSGLLVDSGVLRGPSENRISSLEAALTTELSRLCYRNLSVIVNECQTIYVTLVKAVTEAYGGAIELRFNVEQCGSDSHTFGCAIHQRDHIRYAAYLTRQDNVRKRIAVITENGRNIIEACRTAIQQFQLLQAKVDGLKDNWAPLSDDAVAAERDKWAALWMELKGTTSDLAGFHSRCMEFLTVSVRCFCQAEMRLVDRVCKQPLPDLQI